MGTWEVMGLSHHHTLPPKYPKPCERGREGGTSAVVKFENLAGARPGSAGTTRQRTAAAPRSLGREGEGRGGFGTCSRRLPFRRGDTTSDHVRVANMENAVGMQLFTLCSLESPFPEALFE